MTDKNEPKIRMVMLDKKSPVENSGCRAAERKRDCTPCGCVDAPPDCVPDPPCGCVDAPPDCVPDPPCGCVEIGRAHV